MQHAHKKSELPDFMQRMYEFAAHIRDPQNSPAPVDVLTRRMDTYAELFYNNVLDFLTNAFPVLRKIHDDEQWHAMVRDYFARHRAHTPLFHEMPREFLHYLQNERDGHEDDYPFLLELAHYEWLELELLTTEEIPTDCDMSGDLLVGIPALSPLIRNLSYHYAVHRIGPDYLPTHNDGTSTHLLIYRDSGDDIGFIELNPVTARLLQLIGDQTGASGRELLEQIAVELHHPNPQTVIESGHAILLDLKQRDIILGTRN